MMATASDPASTTHHSPRGSSAMDASATAAAAAAGIHSSQYRRRGSGGVSSPWNQIVRGADLESTISSSYSAAAAAAAATVGISVAPPSLSPSLSSVAQEQVMTSDRSPSKAGAVAAAADSASFLPEDGAGEAQPESSDNGSGGNNAAKKPAWNKPSNGATDGGPVMEGVSWPPLSESTRASPKSSSDSLKTLSDVSVPVSQGTGMASPSAHKQGNNTNTNSGSTPNHTPYNRQRSIKRGGGNLSSNASANGGPSQLSSPRASAADTGPNNSGKPANSGTDSLPRENTHRDGGQRGGSGSQSHSVNEHQQQRNSFRRGSGGPHSRGDGSHHHGYGGRRGDQDRGNQDWNPNRSFGGGRDTHMQPQRAASRPFIRGPTPTPPPFMPPTPMHVRPFGTTIGYPDVPSTVFYLTEPLRAVPMVPPIGPLFFPLPDPQLHTKIVNQIEYYFSNENLIKDTFLRQNMDDQGWVPIKLIASFKKVMQLTDNIQLILDSVKTSSVCEVEGEKVRRRNDWMRWIMPPSVQYSPMSSPQSMQKSSMDILAGNFQSIALDDKTAKQGYGETYLSPSSSGEWSSLSQQSSGEKTSQVAVQAGFPTSGPNSVK